MAKNKRNPDKPIVDPEVHGVRINKYISSLGVSSRREADRQVEAGKVYINGVKAIPGARVMPGDKVELDGVLLKKKPVRQIYIALNKPRGIVSTTDPKEKQSVTAFMNYPERIYPIGRLDKDSEGLLLLTNDGDIVNRILRARYGHEKEYLVRVDKDITDEFVEKMENGVRILDQMTLPCKVRKIDRRTFRITLTQGLNRQIRRMCEALGYEVKRLQRIRIMNITLGNMTAGSWRYLTVKEMRQVEELLLAAEEKADQAEEDDVNYSYDEEGEA